MHIKTFSFSDDNIRQHENGRKLKVTFKGEWDEANKNFFIKVSLILKCIHLGEVGVGVYLLSSPDVNFLYTDKFKITSEFPGMRIPFPENSRFHTKLEF